MGKDNEGINKNTETYPEMNESNELQYHIQRKRVFNLIHQERLYQIMMGKLKGWDKEESKSMNDWLSVIEHELREAKESYFFNARGRDTGYHEILQIASVCVAALEYLSPETLEYFYTLSNPDNADKNLLIKNLSEKIKGE